MKIEIKCLNCGKSFYNWKSQNRKYCSKSCYWAKLDNKYWLGKTLPQYMKDKISYSRKGKMMGESNPRWSEKIDVICKQCGKTFVTIKSREGKALFCSLDCKYESNRTEYGDFKITTKRHFGLKWWRELRQLVIERDKGCKICGSKNHLVAHHKIPYRQTGDNSLNNLIALCKKCHITEERKYYVC